jgi:hypothetical protein
MGAGRRSANGILLQWWVLLGTTACSAYGEAAIDSMPDGQLVADGRLVPDSDEWALMISVPYAVEPGQETSASATAILERDLLIDGIRAIQPPGTHHVVLSVVGQLEHDQLFASGLGTGDLRFPEGVGFTLPAGTELRLDLHFANPLDATIEDVAGIAIHERSITDGLVAADQIYPAVLQGDIPPGTTTLTGRCTLMWPANVFAVLAHMHSIGRRAVLTLHRADGTAEVLFDADVDPTHQSYVMVDPVATDVGDVISIECMYENTSDQIVHIAGSSTDEMCTAMIYRYPASPEHDLYCTR